MLLNQITLKAFEDCMKLLIKYRTASIYGDSLNLYEPTGRKPKIIIIILVVYLFRNDNKWGRQCIIVNFSEVHDIIDGASVDERGGRTRLQ